MKCPRCGMQCSEGASACPGCGTLLGTSLGETVAETRRPARVESRARSRLEPGTRLGNRYEILAVLGEGGMGAVYKAQDLELDRLVALKVIRPEMLSHPGILERFKREILLASKITHKNVLRIHDLGEVGELKFISMAFVEGTDLKTVLDREGPLPLHRAIHLIRQMADALRAAHEAGVVHRDLKPQNILIDHEGNAYVADFGISRSIEHGATMTEVGSVLGTIAYMSPEQARGEPADHRSDVYSLGMIVYEMLTGTLPFQADNALSILTKRVHEDVPSIRIARQDIPPWMAQIVGRALQRDLNLRYQSADELLRDVDRQRASIAWKRLFAKRALYTVAGLGLVAALVAVGAYWLKTGETPLSPAVPPKASLILLPFRNSTGDDRYAWTVNGLPDLLASDLRQSRALRIVGTDRVLEILDNLKIDRSSGFSPTAIPRIAGLIAAENVLTGTLFKVGDRFRVEARLATVGGTTIAREVPLKAEGTGEDALLLMVDELSRSIWDELGVAPGLFERKRKATELTTRSVEALRLYTEGLAEARAGSDLEAAKRLEDAVKEDPDFAVARAELADTLERLGRLEDASREADKAAGGVGRASPYEAARIRAIQARLANDPKGAADALAELTRIAPTSAEAFMALAAFQEDQSDLEGALISLERVLLLDPKNPNARYSLGRVLVKLSRHADAMEQFGTTLNLYTEAGNDEGRARVLLGIGNTFRAQGQTEEALTRYRESHAIRERIGDQRGVGAALNNIALSLRDLGRYGEAIETARRSLETYEKLGDAASRAATYSNLGDIFYNAGRTSEALEAYQASLKIARSLGDEMALAQTLGDLASIYEVVGKYDEAFLLQREALAKRREIGQKSEILRGLNDIGYVEQIQGRYAEALKYYLEGMTLANETDDRPAKIALKVNLATIHEDQGDYGATLATLAEAEAEARVLGDKYLLATSLGALGDARRRLGDSDGAAAAIDEALQLVREIGNPSLEAEILASQASLLVSRKQVARGEPLLRKALDLAEVSRDFRLQLLVRMRMAETAGSVRDLEALVQEAESAGLSPLVAPARLAVARIHRAAARPRAAVTACDQAVQAAGPLGQRDVLFQAQALAASMALADPRGRQVEAAEHASSALIPLEEMRKGLAGEPLLKFLARSETTDFARLASTLFQAAGRPTEAERLRSLLKM